MATPISYSSRYFGVPNRRIQGFSLVEVTISLGIIAVVLSGITAILAASCYSTRYSADDTSLTVITRNVVEDVRNRGVDTLTTAGSDTRYFFSNGSPCSNPSRALYKCEVSAIPDENTMSAQGAVNLVMLHLRVSWPSESTPKNIYVNVARY